jgi:hypothetical protein
MGREKQSREHPLIYPRLPWPTPYALNPNLRLLLNTLHTPKKSPPCLSLSGDHCPSAEGDRKSGNKESQNNVVLEV